MAGKHLFDLAGCVSIVTGSGSGLGQAIALGFADFGSKVVIADSNLTLAQETARQVQRRGGEASACELDVTDEASVQRIVQDVAKVFHRIDILVNSAGVASHSAAEELTQEEWNRVMDVNLKGSFLCCRAVGPLMLERRKGSIVNVISIGGLVGMGRGTTAYSASKGGVVMLTRDLAVEWAARGVRVNGLAPCQFRTPMLEKVLNDPQYDPNQLMNNWVSNIPLGRIGAPEEIVGPAVFLASDASSMVTGHILAVDGGYLAR